MTTGQKLSLMRKGCTNSNGHPEGWPSITNYEADCIAYLGADTVLAGLPAGPARLPTRFTRLGLIHREGTAVELFAVEPLNGGFGRRTVGHFDEAKAFGAPGVPVSNNIDLVYHTMGLEELAKAIIRRTKRKVAYKDIHVQSSSS